LTVAKAEIAPFEDVEPDSDAPRVLDRFTDEELAEINRCLEDAHPMKILQWTDDTFGAGAIQMSSFAIDGMAIFDMYWKINPKARLATLDTMRLFEETYDLMDRIARRYNTEVEVHYPDIRAVGRMIRQHGMNLFYKGVQNRKLCCEIRKVNPLNQALNETDAWITGLRRDQGMQRGEIDIVQKDVAHDAYKINPLANWSAEQIRQYVIDNKVPYNVLHDQGYPSIGCAPCTRAVEPGEDERSGRWWWESDPDAKECGIHVVAPTGS
jgi:phosphoadenosine phosphosulfate reductase